MNSLKHNKLILIGSSTGGPGLIETIIRALPEKICGDIIIAQHMNTLSLKSFASRLNRITKIEVDFVTQKTTLNNNKIYVLSDNSILSNQNNINSITIQNDNNNFYHPTIDLLFNSAVNLSHIDISAYILSGIGRDGASGLLSLKNMGYECIAQDKDSSIVYGMPKAAFEANAVNSILSIDEISKKISKDLTCCLG